MKLLINHIKTHYISLCISLLLSLLIWLRGPEITLLHFSPLQSAEQRFSAIILIFLGLFLKFIFLDTKKRKPTHSPETERKLNQLHGHFLGAIAFLKKTMIQKQDKNISLLHLPWYLVIGPTQSGKTSLLTNANINYILAKQGKMDHSDRCHWWVTRDLVLVDVPGNYLSSKNKNAPLLWQHLLKLIKKFRGKKTALHGIVLTLNLPEIIRLQRPQKLQLIQDIKKRTHDVLQSFGKSVPIHIVITKCDLLPGFLEFFGDYSTDETSQAWGVSIPTLAENESLIEVFTYRFNALIKRLNKQVITRLHQERNPLARPYIKDFPLQIEKLKEGIIQVIKALALPSTALQGVYLTSGTQAGREDIHSALTIQQHTQSLQILTTPTMPARSFFARQFLLHNLLVSSAKPKRIHAFDHWQKRLVYTTSLATIITAILFLGRDFQQGLLRAYSIQNNLAEYRLKIQSKNHASDRLTEVLPLLNALKEAANLANDNLAFYSNKSQQTAQALYHQALETLVIPEIKNYFEKYLQNKSQSSDHLYPVLKAYLMLGDKKHFEADFIANVLQQQMPDQVSKDTIKALSAHVHAALNHQVTTTLNLALIEKSRKQLLDLASTDLAFVILKNRDDNNIDIDIGFGIEHKNSAIYINNAIATRLPTLFTAKAFEKVIRQDINQVAEEVLIGNWILGFNKIPPDETAINELTSQLQRQYITKYTDVWESMLANIQFQTPKNITELSTQLISLTSSQSPLLVLLQTIKQHTSFAPLLAVSPKLQNINIFLEDTNPDQSNGLYAVFMGLKHLQMYLLSFSNQDLGVLNATAKRFQTENSKDPLQEIRAMADQSPEPMKHWLNTIVTQTWSFMLQSSKEQIATAWQTQVMPTYHTAIENRYPFNQEAKSEIDLEHFKQFLGQTGILSNFYQTYLKPFITETNKIKSWRFVDGERIALNNEILEKYGHIERLQRAFFPNGDNTLYVPFTLQPLSLDKSMKDFTLNINGQEVRFQKNLPRLLTWPGNQQKEMTAINFVAMNNELLSQSIKGSWGWFRLVKHSTETVRSRKEIALTFDINGHQAKYALLTQGHLNPFLPLNLTEFSLPERI